MTGPVLHVSEVFGPTVQGEGPLVGRACLFVRLGGCNLTCGPCDTPYTWDGSRFDLRREITPMPVSRVLDRVEALAPAAAPSLVVVSGGEPLLHQSKPGLPELVEGLAGRGFLVQFETNGTIAPARWMVEQGGVRWVVSPKLVGPMATDAPGRRLVPEVLGRWADLAWQSLAWFKLVVADPEHVSTVVDFADRYGVPRHRVWVMPEGTDVDAVLGAGRRIAEAATAAGLGLSLRLHVLLWPGQDKGR